jgi:hypothetical protein
MFRSLLGHLSRALDAVDLAVGGVLLAWSAKREMDLAGPAAVRCGHVGCTPHYCVWL